jgi:apolipoprotein N-acyltransferase
MLRPLRSSNPLLFCLVSGGLLSLPFFNGYLWICAWFGLVPLLIALNNQTKIRAFFLAFFCGVIFWSLAIYWLVHVTLLGTVLLVLYLALYTGLFGLLIVAVDYRLSAAGIFIIPSFWVLLEFARSHALTGFPWALIGYSQYLNLPVIQIADVSGVWGVSFVVVMANVALYQTMSGRSRSGLVAGAVVASVLAYGAARLYYQPEAAGDRQMRISVVQGNIPQELKWAPQARSEIIEKYTDLTRQAAAARPDLILWPEAAVPFVVGQEEPEYFNRIKALAQEVKIPLLIGAVTRREEHYYNSALMLNAGGEVTQVYDKVHLVPFGEYIPLRRIFPVLETIAPIGDISPGKDYTVFEVALPSAAFSALICFEDLFPELSRAFLSQGAAFLVNITNDAWYKKTPAAFQHLQASVLRAVENRVWILRAANTGISAFITPT